MAKCLWCLVMLSVLTPWHANDCVRAGGQDSRNLGVSLLVICLGVMVPIMVLVTVFCQTN